MAITNFIPEVWSAAILEALRAKLVFPSLCNRDYEGDIREAGDTVHITGYDDVTVRKYVRGQAITVDDANDKEAAVLEIDQSDYFAFKVNDLNKAQAKADMTGKFTNSAAYNMMKNVENYISNLMDTAVSTPAKTVAVGTPADAYLAVRGSRTETGCSKRARRGPLARRQPRLLRAPAAGLPLHRRHRSRS